MGRHGSPAGTARALALVAAALVATASCSTAEDDRSSAAPSPVVPSPTAPSPAAFPGRLSLPIERFALTTDESYAVERANVLLTNECLQGFGLDYRVPDVPPPVAAGPSRRYGITDRTAAHDRGYHLGHVTGHSIGMTMIEFPKIGEGVETELAENMVLSMHPHAIAANRHNRAYLEAKARRAGHLLEE